jgi:hypothetical protein
VAERSWGGGLREEGLAEVRIRNSIFWDNQSAESTGKQIASDGETHYTVYRSNIEGGAADAHMVDGDWPENPSDPNHSIDEDPLFEDPGAGDYRLQDGSPSIASGSVDFVPCNLHLPEHIGCETQDCDSAGVNDDKHPIDLDGHLRIVSNCSKVDQGAYQSIPACPWDVNGDGAVDVLDLLILLDCWGPVGGPECEPPDFNSDGAIDVLDLLEMLDNWGPCPSGDHQGGGGTVPVQFQDCWDDYQVHGDPDRFLGCMDWVENMDFYLAP